MKKKRITNTFTAKNRLPTRIAALSGQPAGLTLQKRSGADHCYDFSADLQAADRGKVLFRLDQNAPLRFSHENPAVQALYREYLDEPCSHRAEELLHCDHFAWQMPQNPR